MQFSAGATVNTNELYSADGILRGKDSSVNAGLNYSAVRTRAGSGGNVGLVFFENPTASDKVSFIDSLEGIFDETGDVIIGFLSNPGSSGDANWINQKSGGAAGSSRISVVNPAAPGVTEQRRYKAIANEKLTIKFDFPYQVDAGNFFAMYHVSTTSTQTITYIGREMDV